MKTEFGSVNVFCCVDVLSESDTVLCLCISVGSAVPALQLPQLPEDTYKSVPDDEINN